MGYHELSDRERKVLEAVIQSYVETAEPAGSRTISRRFGLGVSPATIRNTMSDLEEKGFLYHPHTSAGRVPTDRAYRLYVDTILRTPEPDSAERRRLEAELRGSGNAIEGILRRAAQSLGVLTQELGVVLGPTLDRTLLERLELVRLASDKLILVLTLSGGSVRTVFVEVPGEIADAALAEVTLVLNERLAGVALGEIRRTLPARLRDGSATAGATELLNIFIAEGEQLFDLALPAGEANVVLGQASHLADQPEFASGEGIRRLMELTERPQRLAQVLRQRTEGEGITITIGREHGDPLLGAFTVVTTAYRAGGLSGVIGVIGPTRMPYEKVISLVSHTSRLVTEMLA